MLAWLTEHRLVSARQARASPSVGGPRGGLGAGGALPGAWYGGGCIADLDGCWGCRKDVPSGTTGGGGELTVPLDAAVASDLPSLVATISPLAFLRTAAMGGRFDGCSSTIAAVVRITLAARATASHTRPILACIFAPAMAKQAFRMTCHTRKELEASVRCTGAQN